MITLQRRVIRINQNKTSVRLSSLEWQAFDNLCMNEQLSHSVVINLLANNMQHYKNLTAFIRIFTMYYYYLADKKTNKQGHRQPDLNNIFKLISMIA